ncbi:probable calcium-binding protein CML46 [Cornus florida]|uniref:probable calcium-binding protein CML46 n=1 Tax=Cornus florida TaxID=4283 RepID=UPI0028968BEA|nr:probable calcium-binding protein CML46 [Cornus florida]
MEWTPTKNISSVLLFFFRILFSPDIKVYNFFSYVQHFFQILMAFVSSTKWKLWANIKAQKTEPLNQQFCFQEKPNEEAQLCSKDLKMVMDSLGIFLSVSDDSDPCGDKFGVDELSELFDEEEPSLEELKETFDVFDENKDGFIDAIELQRVLCILGLKERSKVEDCRKMISAFDENGDGIIDFDEFLKFMEICNT